MLIDIDKIIVKDRIRKDFGNIEGLANSIKKIGLANAILITPDFELIAGERRYKAVQLLGYKQIEARIMSVEDEEHMLSLEIDENEERKEFSKLERLDWARKLERLERIKAKERQRSNVSNLQVIKGSTRDIVAEKLGIGSGKQYEKEKYIENNLHFVTDEEKLAWDNGDISDHAMYKKIKLKNSRDNIPKATTKALMYRSGCKCEICGGHSGALSTRLQEHHITEYCKTRDNSYDNLLLICPNCHDLLTYFNNNPDEKLMRDIIACLNINTRKSIEQYINF